MFSTYLKTVTRRFVSSKLYSAINILGLAIGLACCLLILLYVQHETSYESSFANADRIYRISREFYPREGARLRTPASNNAPVASALVADYPQLIEHAARIYGGDIKLTTDEITSVENEVRFADAAILQIFNFQWLVGNAETALQQPNSIVLTESLARKYFGTAEAVGRSLRAMDFYDLKVTGVIRDLPEKTHLSISGLASLSSMIAARPSNFEQWNSSTDFHTYVLLRTGASIDALMQEVDAFLTRHIGEDASKISTMRAMNIRNIHLQTNRDEEWKVPGSQASVNIFIAIALAVLLIACINFMAIATARSFNRAKEVGMRKTVGASRVQLVLQFLGESTLVTFVAFVGALVLVELLLPTFATLMSVQLQFGSLLQAQMLPVLALLLVGVSVLAGAYPAFYLAAFEPAKVLKGELSRGAKGLWLRNALVVLQFAIAITLLIATAVIYIQRHYATRFEVGFNKDQIVNVRAPSATGFGNNWLAFKEQLLKSPAIESVTASHYLPFGFDDNQIPLQLVGASSETNVQYMLVDHDFFSTYEIPLLAGRAFSRDIESDSILSTAARPAIVMNRSAARAFDLEPGAAVGSEVLFNNGLGKATADVVGVTTEIYFESVRLGERPMIFFLHPAELPPVVRALRDASIRIKAGMTEQALAHIDNTWRAFNPSLPINRHFLTTDFTAMYQADKQQGELLAAFAIVALTITCFGLFGLASFNAERRTKEIGVRKVLGGSVWSIVLLLTKDFSKLVLLSNVIAWPIAYYAMSRWLENFAYRIDLTPLIFIGSGLIALCIAWVTVGGTAAKAASQKPVLTLRYE